MSVGAKTAFLLMAFILGMWAGVHIERHHWQSRMARVVISSDGSIQCPNCELKFDSRKTVLPVTHDPPLNGDCLTWALGKGHYVGVPCAPHYLEWDYVTPESKP